MKVFDILHRFDAYLHVLSCTDSSRFVHHGIRFCQTEITVIQVDRNGDLDISMDGLTSAQYEAARWACSIKNDDFYHAIVASVFISGNIDIQNSTFTCTHSLTTNYATWLIGKHRTHGITLILQSNYSYEAVYFDELRCYVILPQGIEQLAALGTLVGQMCWPINKEPLSSYLQSVTSFCGINYSYPSPFHNITFGHTSLASLHMAGQTPHLTAYVKRGNIWFDPTRLFPLVVSSVIEFDFKGQFLELATDNKYFLYKLGHLYRTAAIENRILDIAFLASGAACREEEHRSLANNRKTDGICVWIGLTSGKRSLVNEKDVLMTALSVMQASLDIGFVFIDGWTGSSLHTTHSSMRTSTDMRYAGHDKEVEQLSNGIIGMFPHIQIQSLVGLSYEQKVAIALLCEFSITSAYTSSVVPSRIVSLNGIVHASNAGRSTLNMHIWRKAQMIPPHIVYDVESNTSKYNPEDVSYSIDILLFKKWFSKHFQDVNASSSVPSRK